MKLIAAALVCLLFMAPIMGYLSSPWAAFWNAGSNAIPPPIVFDANPQTVASDPLDLLPPTAHGAITDAVRYQLARGAGWTAADAITAAAISMAENGSGDPAVLSGENWNHTRDLGLWQINSNWWAQFGGHQALIDPWRNVQAAYYIYGRQGWCAWSTYGPCPTHACGPPCYSSFLKRATDASHAQPVEGQA